MDDIREDELARIRERFPDREEITVRDVFAYRVEELIWRRKLKPTEIAERVGISYKQLWRYLRETQNPPLEVVVKIADALGVSVDYLLGRVSEVDQTVPEDREYSEQLKFIRRAYRTLSPKERDALYELAKILAGEADEKEKSGGGDEK